MKRAVLLFLGVLALCPWAASAHDVPDDVRIKIFLKPEGGRMRILVRIPANALIDILYPTLPDSSWLDLKQADAFAEEGAKVWVADLLSLREGDNPLATPQLLAVRISRASNASFNSFQQALQHINGDRLPAETLLTQDQAVVDTLLETPIQSEYSSFTFEPGFARVGVRVTTTLAFLPPDGGIRQFEYEGDTEPFKLNPTGIQAVTRLFQDGFGHFLSETDYLIFLVCIALVFERFRALVPFAIAFAVAQFIALIGTALGLTLSGQWAPVFWGVLAAAATVYMGIEAIVAVAANDNKDKRLALAAATGLVFGSGFWFALDPVIQFGGTHRLASILAFDAGIVICYASALALVVILVKGLLRISSGPRTAVTIAAAIAVRISWHRMLDRAHALSVLPMSFPVLNLTMFTLVGIVAAAILVATAYRSHRSSSAA